METDFKTEKTIHLGRKVQRVREIIGYKQSTLAERAGMSQQNISKLEQSEQIPDETLEELAKGLGVTADFIKNFDEEKAIYNIQTHFTYHNGSTNSNLNWQPTFINNPIDKVVELFEKLLQSEKEKLEILNTLTKQIEELKGNKDSNG